MSMRFFTRTLLELGHSVVAFTPDPENLRSWMDLHSPHLASDLQIIEMRYPRPNPRQGRLLVIYEKLAWIRFVAKSIRSAGVEPDLVIHTWLDYCLTPGLTANMMDLLFPYRWSGLWFHPWYLRRKQKYSAFRRGPFSSHSALLSRNCTGVGILDEGIEEKLRQRLGGKPIIVFPDVADPAPPNPRYPPAREIRERAGGRKIIALVGILERRKGMRNLIEVARRSTDRDWFFVFAGKLQPHTFRPEEIRDIYNFIDTKPSNCYFSLERIPSESDFNAVIDTADVLYGVYENFLSSSNLLTKASLFQKPVLACDSFCIGERMSRYGIGISVPPNDPSRCIDALHRLTDPAAAIAPSKFAAYLKDHSEDRLLRSFALLLQTAFPNLPIPSGKDSRF